MSSVMDRTTAMAIPAPTQFELPGGPGVWQKGSAEAAPSAPDVHAYSRPARAFTGDFYYTHRHHDRTWLALGDVAGKGLRAALVMALIQEELEYRITRCAVTQCDPSSTMSRLDAFLKPLLPSNRFATAVIGHLSDRGKLVLANAGHCAPLIARRSGMIERLGSTGPVVGMLPSPRWRSVTTTLESGDTLLLYSDGLLEAKAPDGEEFGIERIERALRRDCKDARQVVAGMLVAVDGHAAGRPDDDLTIVAVRF